MTREEFESLEPVITSEILINEVVNTILFVATDVEEVFKTYTYEFQSETPWNDVVINVFNGDYNDIAIYLEENTTLV